MFISKWSKDKQPMSFILDGKSSKDFLPSWELTEETIKNESGQLRRMKFEDPMSRLIVSIDIRSFDKFPAAEWVVSFENKGDKDTGLIENILPLDTNIEVDFKKPVYLHHAKGSTCVIDDFTPLHTGIGGHYPAAFEIQPEGGRSSDNALPFMNLQITENSGLMLAVGWSGQWLASFARNDKQLQISAGMAKTHLRLHPGEKIRTPRILLIDWYGDDPITGNNLLRKIILDHYSIRKQGEVAIPPVAHMTMCSHHLNPASLTFEGEVKAVEKGHEIGVEAHWVDACWFATGQWEKEVGDWRIRREVFPDGLKPLSDIIHKNNMEFILWFEPERVCKETPLALNHPDWMLADKDSCFYLLNLGIPEARQYITDVVSRFIKDFQVDIYRQDFNMSPLAFWKNADSVDRIGMTEIRHIEGLYKFWDELRRRHPNLVIDNCASGGRRIDLETTSRSYPLWRSDYSDMECLKFPEHVRDIGAQCQTVGLSRWVPLHAAAVWRFTPYAFRSAMSSGVVPYSDIRTDEFPTEKARAAIAELKRLRPYFLGDFYPLLTLSDAFDQWCAYQYHRPDTGAGFAVYLRRHKSPLTEMKSALRAIDKDKDYIVRLYYDFEQTSEILMNGAELTETIISIPDCPGSLLLEYLL